MVQSPAKIRSLKKSAFHRGTTNIDQSVVRYPHGDKSDRQPRKSIGKY
jgi:hypothetical protein